MGWHASAGIGATLMLGKTLTIVIGMQLISYAANVDCKRRSLRIKVLGMALAQLVGPIAEVSAYAFAPQSLLAPLNGFDLVWNVMLAPYTLGEHVNKRKVLGTLIVFVGAIVAPIFGPHNAASVTLDDLRRNFFSFRFLLYVAVSLLLTASALVELKRRNNKDIVRGLLIGVGAGFVAGQTYFLAASSTLLQQSLSTGTWSDWYDWLPYVVVVGAVTCAIFNAVLLNIGLAEFEATIFVPIFAGSGISAACVSAVVVMRETAKLSYWRVEFYWLGILIIVLGLGLLTRDAYLARPAAAEMVPDNDSVECGSPVTYGKELAMRDTKSYADDAEFA